jgi:hypothetical protein
MHHATPLLNPRLALADAGGSASCGMVGRSSANNDCPRSLYFQGFARRVKCPASGSGDRGIVGKAKRQMDRRYEMVSQHPILRTIPTGRTDPSTSATSCRSCDVANKTAPRPWRRWSPFLCHNSCRNVVGRFLTWSSQLAKPTASCSSAALTDRQLLERLE